MSDGGEIASRFLVDATGRSRVLARKFHARVEFHDRLIGLASNFTTTVERSVRSMTVRAAPFGWWYAAPTPRGHVVTLFTDSDLAPRKAEHRLQPVAANSAFTHWDAGEDWLPVGDAYASHDPLCGWGVVRALNNGRMAADSIEEYLRVGDRSQINAYRSHCEAQFNHYLDGLKSRYTMEDRWPSAPFWARRRSV
jgi:flavin-dependent dehydrogenase